MPYKHRQWRFHGLKKPKIRQDWNKYNFYNLARMTIPFGSSRTFFQQKWTAKAATRAYHGEQIMEKKWERMFDRRIPAVVPQDPKFLAENDGSIHSAGRGSGKQGLLTTRKKAPAPTPYMQMVYHPTERRLDTAIFRALFASSARQARQFVTHGHVKVNGKRMIYPGYMLNPGDMFQVEPTRVLRSTGTVIKPKPKTDPNTVKAESKETNPASDESLAAAEDQPTEDQTAEEDLEDQLTEEEASISESDPAATTKKALLALRTLAIELEEHPPKGKKLSGKLKQDMRAFRKTVKTSISRAASVSPSTLDDLELEWQSLSNRADSQTNAAPSEIKSTTDVVTAKPDASNTSEGEIAESSKDSESEEVWEPKPYMSAFAFIPRYLEVNHSICSAIYLRHPVCKPGFAEVPTPFHQETGQLTFNWYLRRR